MTWKNPRWNSLTGPDADALRQIFESLSLFLANPVFNNGIQLGNGGTPSYDPGTDMVQQPAQTPVDSDTLDDIVAGLPPDDGVAPATPCEFVASSGGVRSVYLAWDEAPEDDVKDGWGNYRVQLDDTNSTFGSVVVDEMVGGTQTTITGLQTNKAYYARVAPVDAYGNQGPWNSPVGVTTVQVANADIAAEAVTADKIQANTITANEIAADAITATELAAIELEVGKHIRSTSYTPDVDGWAIDADGSAEFNDVKVRGEVTATEFHGVRQPNLLADGGFDVGTSDWSDSPDHAGTTTISRVTSPVRSGTHALRATVASGTPTILTSTPAQQGDTFHFQAWVRLNSEAGAGLEGNNVLHAWFATTDGGVVMHLGGKADVLATQSDWVLLESYYQVPEDDGYTADEVRVIVSSGGGSNRIFYMDDCHLSHAPLIEIPYLTTSDESVDRNRTQITPGRIDFTGPHSRYPYGLVTRESGESAALLVNGPYGPFEANAQLSLSRDPITGATSAAILADAIYVGGNSTDANGPWEPYTPSLSNVAGSPNVDAYYMLMGKTCYVRFSMRFAAGVSFTGTVSVGLPLTAAAMSASTSNYQIIMGYAFDGNGVPHLLVGRIQSSGNGITPIVHGASGGVNATQPFTWTTGDVLVLQGCYEIA